MTSKKTFEIPLKDQAKGLVWGIEGPAFGGRGHKTVIPKGIAINSSAADAIHKSLAETLFPFMEKRKKHRDAGLLDQKNTQPKPFAGPYSFEQVKDGETRLVRGWEVKQFGDNSFRRNFQRILLGNLDTKKLRPEVKAKIITALDECALIVKEALYQLSVCDKTRKDRPLVTIESFGKSVEVPFGFHLIGLMPNADQLPLPPEMAEKFKFQHGATFQTLLEETLAKGVAPSTLNREYVATLREAAAKEYPLVAEAMDKERAALKAQQGKGSPEPSLKEGEAPKEPKSKTSPSYSSGGKGGGGGHMPASSHVKAGGGGGKVGWWLAGGAVAAAIVAAIVVRREQNQKEQPKPFVSMVSYPLLQPSMARSSQRDWVKRVQPLPYASSGIDKS